MQRRIVLIPFRAKFEGKDRDDNLLGKLKAEGPQILHWMIEGAAIWIREGLALPEDIMRESAQYMAEMDDIAEWVEDCCELHLDYREAMSDLHKSFAHWKEERGEKAPGLMPWRERLLQQHPAIEAKRTKKARLATGIQLNNEEKRRVQG
jgi:putative DNA primase/helicase